MWSVRKGSHKPFSHKSHQWDFWLGMGFPGIPKKQVLPIGYEQFQIFSLHFFCSGHGWNMKVPYIHFGGVSWCVQHMTSMQTSIISHIRPKVPWLVEKLHDPRLRHLYLAWWSCIRRAATGMNSDAGCVAWCVVRERKTRIGPKVKIGGIERDMKGPFSESWKHFLSHSRKPQVPWL